MTDKQALRRVARNVKRLREQKGWSMGQLARAIDDYPATVKRIEHEENMPGVGLLTRLAEALEVTMNDLLADPKDFVANAS